MKKGCFLLFILLVIGGIIGAVALLFSDSEPSSVADSTSPASKTPAATQQLPPPEERYPEILNIAAVLGKPANQATAILGPYSSKDSEEHATWESQGWQITLKNENGTITKAFTTIVPESDSYSISSPKALQYSFGFQTQGWKVRRSTTKKKGILKVYEAQTPEGIIYITALEGDPGKNFSTIQFHAPGQLK